MASPLVLDSPFYSTSAAALLLLLQGMRRNPFAPIVPCHRVIASSLELGGFSGSWGNGCENVQRKRSMLAKEGVPFDDAGRLSDQSCLMGVEELRLSAKAAGVTVVR